MNVDIDRRIMNVDIDSFFFFLVNIDIDSLKSPPA